MTTQKAIEKIIERAPNQDWKRDFTIYREYPVTLINPHNQEKLFGKFIYVKFTEPEKLDRFKGQGRFEGFVARIIPKAYINDTHPIILYNKDTFEDFVRHDFVDGVESGAVARLQDNLKYRGCPECKSLKPLKLTGKRRCGPECVHLTYTCQFCGYKDYDVFD